MKTYHWLMGLEPEERKEYLFKREDLAKTETRYFCKTCRDSGFIYYPTTDRSDKMFGKHVICPECNGKGKEIEHYPSERDKIWEMTFEHWFHTKGTEESFKFAKSWADGSADFIWLLIYGSHGSGKTHLTKASKDLLKRRGFNAIYIYALDLFDDLRHAIDRKNLDERINMFKTITYLIIDDYFLDSKSDWLPAKMEQLLNYRYENYLPLMLTMNGTPEILSPAILSRFKDHERARMALNNAGDYRPKKGSG